MPDGRNRGADCVYGYKMGENNRLVIDELPAENVKFVFRKTSEYNDEPPESLVQEVLEREGTLTYEEAKSLVSISAIELYVANEVRLKNMAFTLSDAPATVETLRCMLNQPLEEFDSDEIESAFIGKMKHPDEEWERRIRSVSAKTFYPEIPTWEGRTLHALLSSEEGGVACEHEPIISKEQFQKVKQFLEKKQKVSTTHDLTMG